MVPYTETFENILKDFEDAGIPMDAPGFYDHPAFAERCARDPAYLNNYARFVTSRPYAPAYLAHAEKTVRTVGDILHRELVADGRLGACIDMSLVMARILDKLGIWNFPVLGALTTTYPEATGIARGFYWPIDHGATDAGHAWIFVPPFTVVDITVGQQVYSPGLHRYFPDAIYSKPSPDVAVDIEDVCSSSILMEMDAQGLPWSLEGLFATHPQFESFFQTFPRTVVTHEGASHKYVPVAVAPSSEGPLEQMTDLQLCGKHGQELFDEKIRPLFNESVASPVYPANDFGKDDP